MMTICEGLDRVMFALKMTSEKYDNQKFKNDISEIIEMAEGYKEAISKSLFEDPAAYTMEEEREYKKHSDIIKEIVKTLTPVQRSTIYNAVYKCIEDEYEINLNQLKNGQYAGISSKQRLVFKLGKIEELEKLLTKHIKEA